MPMLFEYQRKRCNGRALLVTIGPASPKQFYGVANLAGRLPIVASYQRLHELGTRIVGHCDEPPSIVALLGEA